MIKVMKHSIYLLVLIPLFVSLGCSQSLTIEQLDVMSGTFELTMETDSMNIEFKVELVTAIDSAVIRIYRIGRGRL